MLFPGFKVHFICCFGASGDTQARAVIHDCGAICKTAKIRCRPVIFHVRDLTCAAADNSAIFLTCRVAIAAVL